MGIRYDECACPSFPLTFNQVLDTVLIFFVALVARDPVDLPEISTKASFAPTLYNLLGALDRGNDPLWLISADLSDPVLKRAGIGRSEATAVSDLQRHIIISHFAT